MKRVDGLTCLTIITSIAISSLPRAGYTAEAAQNQPSLSVPVKSTQEIDRLLKQVDADRDKKITIDDLHSKKSSKTKSTFWLKSQDGRELEVTGVYYLSNLLQELKLATDPKNDKTPGTIQSHRIFENPVDRIARSIRERYWDNLTRRVDVENLAQVLPDEKVPKAEIRNLYVPAGDQTAFDYFEKASRERPELKFKVTKLPPTLNADQLQELAAKPGLLTLALEKKPDGRLVGVPFVVPGGRFNEMYGWDSYFEALGLISDGRLDLAKAMVDNFVYEIEHYGKILNANRSYYLNRSQPPFLTSMISAVWEKMPKTPENKEWLGRSLSAAINEYFGVWMNSERLTATGLSRYFGNGRGVPPEVEKGHFDFFLKPAARKHGLSVEELTKRYNSGKLKDPSLDEFFAHDRAVRESGHDTTYRWRVANRDRAADFVTVDLNSLLLKYEIDLAKLIRTEFGDSFTVNRPIANVKAEKMTSAEWRDRAANRSEVMRKLLWDPERKIFFDYNFKDQKRSNYVSATAFYPFWALDPADPATRILDTKEAKASMLALLKELELPGGVASTSATSLKAQGDAAHARQWEYPNGWAPHQMILWVALKNHQMNNTADRLIYKWLYTITRNATDYNGTVPEKFDLLKRSHAVFAEYGNVGTQFSYITQEGFGWMNASYQVGLRELSAPWQPRLRALEPPEWIAFPSEP